jgi:hypothetical protein
MYRTRRTVSRFRTLIAPLSIIVAACALFAWLIAAGGGERAAEATVPGANGNSSRKVRLPPTIPTGNRSPKTLGTRPSSSLHQRRCRALRRHRQAAKSRPASQAAAATRTADQRICRSWWRARACSSSPSSRGTPAGAGFGKRLHRGNNPPLPRPSVKPPIVYFAYAIDASSAH